MCVPLNLDDGIADRRKGGLCRKPTIRIARLKLLKPGIRVANGSVARVPLKQAEPIYTSTWWKETRKRIFARDHYTCVVPGCDNRAVVCEHIVSRRNRGTNDDGNLCSLCRYHDNHFKENPDGRRSNAAEWSSIFAASGGSSPNAPPRLNILNL